MGVNGSLWGWGGQTCSPLNGAPAPRGAWSRAESQATWGERLTHLLASPLTLASRLTLESAYLSKQWK